MGSLRPPPSATATNAATTTTTTTTTIATSLLIPKIEPDTEPVEDLPISQPQSQPQRSLHSSISSSAPAFFPNSPNVPSPASAPTADANTGSSSVGNKNACSEFNRIGALFRSELAQRLRGYEDFTVLDSESGAIVPVPEENSSAAVAQLPHAEDNNRLSTFFASKRPKQQRSSELVRVTNLGIEDERNFRDIVKKTRIIYDSLRIFLTMEEDKRQGIGIGKRARVDLKAASVMKDSGLWLNRDKRIVGSIPGVEIGDLFFFRMELCVVGLHGQTQAGIDFLPASYSSNREPIATSVIVSGGYEDDEDAGDVIIYTGHGGQDKFGRQAEHQKLEGGNLAMERSMCYGIEVRVIRGFKYENSISSKVYVYDGLFRIVDCWFDVGKSGFGVFKYRLERIEGQPEMGSSIMRLAQTLRTKPLSVRTNGYLSFDISNQNENVPIALYNDIDVDQEPLFYEYLKKMVFPPFLFIHESRKVIGCNCVSICSGDCLCAMKNGGELPYDHSGNLLRGKPLIFECGPSCQCSPNCRNRVTQRGLSNRLEVFRSQETGWGVRSLGIIHAGSFICEYAGVALTRDQAEILSMNGDTLVYPGRFSERWGEWGDLSQILVDYVRPTQPSTPPLDFAMDVSKMRNVACYLSHSTAPNVMAQFVLYDHSNLMFPHVMLFALENIPPLTELSLDYGVADEWNGKLAICN